MINLIPRFLLVILSVTFSVAALNANAAPVVWSDIVNATANGNTLTNNAIGDGLVGSGRSVETFGAGVVGSFTFTLIQPGARYSVGLNRGTTARTRAGIDYAIHFNGGGSAEIWESGVYKFDTPYADNDTFTVESRGDLSKVRYKKNGVLFYTSTVAPTYPLYLNAALESASSKVYQANSSTTPEPPLSAVWANDGGNKIAQHELRASNGVSVINRTWDGTTIKIFGAKNEVVNFNLILEAANGTSNTVSVSFNQLTGPGGAVIRSVAPATADGVFNWVQRDIELFYVRYLQIKGLSQMSYGFYDERHIPAKFRRPLAADGSYTGGWLDRPHHDKFYPDIAVPIELVPTFTVSNNRNQSIWADIYIPTTAVAGVYTGTVTVKEGGAITKQIPVQLTVRNFTLPDTPNSKTMVALEWADIAHRYTGIKYPNSGTQAHLDTVLVHDRHFMLAHRHKISLIDKNQADDAYTADRPHPVWVPRLDGSLFTATKGYRGPGTGIGNGVFAIGIYGQWRSLWDPLNHCCPTQAQVQTRTNNWETWFQANSPNTERFLYLIDESEDYAQTEKWAGWVKTNPGIGKNLKTFATLPLDQAVKNVPSLNIPASWISVAPKTVYDNATAQVNADPTKDYYFYNGQRPASGSFATEDEGVALRELPWGQYKKGISRWFAWQGTYYNDYQGGRGEKDMFISALTFGGTDLHDDPNFGQQSWNYSNGDGVLFYPGTDLLDSNPDPNVMGTPFTNYGLKGPIASLRLKHWRRGIQDVDYITLAKAIDPVAAQAIVNTMVPKVMWENDVADPADPTWQLCPISWSTNPDVWEAAREDLANIIEGP